MRFDTAHTSLYFVTSFIFLRSHAQLSASQRGGRYVLFTVNTLLRRPILLEPSIQTALRAAIESARVTHPFVIDAWVFLPDHMHCIWTLPDGDANFSVRWNMIKRLVSQACANEFGFNQLSTSREKRSESGIWQRRFWEHLIRDELDFEKHVDYVHVNPLKHGLVQRVSD
jgi:putative transposase